jgi:glucokinase
VIETSEGELSGEFKSADKDLESFICLELESSRETLEAVHIAYAGQVVNGNIYSAPNVDADHTRLKSVIERRFNIPVKIENDLKCAALAEYHAREKCVSLFAAYIGTGFGGALVEEERLLRGNSNMAGEVGHIPFKKAPFLCGCGKDDCVEIYCSGKALVEWVAYYGLECVPTLEAIELSNDEKAALILQNFYDALSHAVSTIVTLFNPTYLILGGAVINNNPMLEHYVQKSVQNHSFLPAAKDIKIETTRLNNGCLEGTKWL